MPQNRSKKPPKDATIQSLKRTDLVQYSKAESAHMGPTSLEDEFLSVREAADLLRVKVSTLYVWCQKRCVPHRRHGSRLVFGKHELCAWSASRAVPPNDPA